MTSTPAPEPTNTPTAGRPTTPAAGATDHTPTTNKPTITLTRPQKALVTFGGAGAIAIAGIGFYGSYHAVTQLAYAKGFGSFSRIFTLGVDIGVGVFLALDLLLTWLRMPYPLLRHGAWLLTAATISFNAVISWPDPIGVGMHAVIPILFVIAVEAARHAVGRIADITADKYMEGPPPSRWLLNPIGTFVLWRRQRLWGIRTWDKILGLERERRIYIGKLRKEHGRTWRRKATADQLLVLRLAKDGMSVTDAMALPAKEEEKRRREEDRIAREKQKAEDERRREQDEYEREQKRLEDDDRRKREQDELERQRAEDERIREQENDRIERERKELELAQQRAEDERQKKIADAKMQAQLDEISRRSQEAQNEAEKKRREDELQHARQLTAEKQKAANAAKALQDAQEGARLEAERKLEASRRAADLIQRTANASASASPVPASRTANASRPAANDPANEVASAAANGSAGTASPASASTATSVTAANASANQTAATSATASASTVDINQVVEVYQLLKAQEGKAPSDAKLGQALGVSRSRAQQLRTAAIEAGHTELAKPLRIAS